MITRSHAPLGDFPVTAPRLGRRNAIFWQPDEDALILEMTAMYGTRWSVIATHLPHRTDSAVRNRFMRIQHGIKKTAASPESCYRCRQCGQLKRGHTCTARPGAGVQAPQYDVPIDILWELLTDATDATEATEATCASSP